MGAWGPALFSDDTACGVRDDYRALIEDGVDDVEAQSRVLSAYAAVADDPDDGPVLWLALAFTQSKIGRLDPAVAARAIAVIEGGEGLDRWSGDPKLLARRQTALEKVRQQLIGPQPNRERLRPPRRRVTDLEKGQLIGYQSGGRHFALRVATISSTRTADHPIVVLLDYFGTEPVEPGGVLSDRAPNPSGAFDSPQPAWASVVFQPSDRAADSAAMAENGFVLIGTHPGQPDDDNEAKWFYRSYLLWYGLALRLDRNAREAP